MTETLTYTYLTQNTCCLKKNIKSRNEMAMDFETDNNPSQKFNTDIDRLVRLKNAVSQYLE